MATIARNDLTRAFIFPDGVEGCCPDSYFSPCITMDSLSQSKGDIESIECPSDTQFGEFKEVGNLPGEVSRMTTTLTARYMLDQKSSFYEFFQQGCSMDLHLNFGTCTNPKDGNTFSKKLIFEDVQVTAYNTDPLSAQQSGDRAAINESIDVSIGSFFEVMPLSLKSNVIEGASGSVVGLEVVDQRRCSSVCGARSNGCQNVWAITDAGDLVFSSQAHRAGGSWEVILQDAVNLPTSGLAYTDGYLFFVDANGNFVYQSPEGLHEGDAWETAVIDATDPAVLTANTGAFDATDSYILIGGADGLVFSSSSPANGAENTVSTWDGDTVWNVVRINHITSDALLGGTDGALVWTDDGENFIAASSVPASVSASTITAVWAKSNQHWYIGTSDGEMWCTEDCGVTWTEVKNNASAAIDDIIMVSNHVGYMISDGILFRTYDGGKTWTRQPQLGSRKVTTATVTLNGIEGCVGHLNTVFGYGADASGDPLIYLGHAE